MIPASAPEAMKKMRSKSRKTYQKSVLLMQRYFSERGGFHNPLCVPMLNC